MTIDVVIPNYNGLALLKENLPKVVEAVEKYKTFVPESDLHPNWGKQRAEYLAGECKKN